MKKFLAVTDPLAWFLIGIENGNRSIASHAKITQVSNTLLKPKNKFGIISGPKKINAANDKINARGTKNFKSKALIDPRYDQARFLQRRYKINPGCFKVLCVRDLQYASHENETGKINHRQDNKDHLLIIHIAFINILRQYSLP
jgi:hypothetical protein